MNRCLCCYQPLDVSEHEFHASCSKKLFGQSTPPLLPYAENELESLANEVIQRQVVVTGVQKKLSLHISGKKDGPEKRFTIVGLWGGYILKPPTAEYPQLPEVEAVTMQLAQIANIKTALNSLIRMKSGSLAYITKRMDRTNKGKLAMEDLCQLSGRLTDDKYHGSYEHVGKTVQRYSATPGLDVLNFFEVVLFSYLTGNADMHLKNFSLLEQAGVGMVLSPAYDLVNTALVNPADKEELALTLNGKKSRLKKQDFITAMNTLNLTVQQQDNLFEKMKRVLPVWMERIDVSFLSESNKENYKALLSERINILM